MSRTTAAVPLTATIERLSHEGRGVARVDGKVYFVDGALPGESVRFIPRQNRRRHGSGVLREVLTAAPERVTPRCRYFGTCGGCVLQHLDGAAQVRAEQAVLAESLQRFAALSPRQWLEPLTAESWGYRRKARLGVRFVEKKGGVLVGFREKNKSYITSLAHCDTLHPRIAALLPSLHELVAGLGAPDRIPQIEMVAADNQLAMVLRHLEPLSDADRELLREYARHHALQCFVQPGNNDSATPLWPPQPEPLYYDLDNSLRIFFGPLDFIQAHGTLNRALVKHVLNLLAPDANDTILDLYCGVGNFTLALAQRCRAVLGVDGDERLISRARTNATLNNITNARFTTADLNNEETDFASLLHGCNKVLLDPARNGALNFIKQLGHNLPPPTRLAYVSCNPATLARDAAILTGTHGYHLQHAGTAHMFPHTAHIESVTLFERAG